MSKVEQRNGWPTSRTSGKPPTSQSSSWGFYYYKLAVVAVFFSVVVYNSSSSWNARRQRLPETYALCSRDGEKKIYTVDVENKRVECLLVRGSHVVGSGELERLKEGFRLPVLGISTLAVRYIPEGSIVIPGMSDSHCHILEYGASRQIRMAEAKTVNETVSSVGEYIASLPDLQRNMSRVIQGWGWDHTSWDVKEWPTWENLEANPAIAGRPVILQSRDGHAIWVSRRTLEDNAPYPDEVEGGVIFRDAQGNPTGVFMDSAQDLIARPTLSEDDLQRQFRTTVDEARAVGLTSLHDAGFNPDSLAFFGRQAKTLPIRIYGMTFFDENGPYWGDKIVPLTAKGDERLSARSVKIFADGALRTGGAALYEPYADNPSTRGAMRISAEVLNTVIPKFLRDGWQVNVHAIGDRANGIVLDAFEAALKGSNTNVSALRPRLEHAQIMTKADMERLGMLGVIASVQPTHAISDMWFGLERLGPERVKGLYAFRSILDSGARITLGSDFPVEEINPLKGFYAAISRLAVDGTSPHGPGGWFPDQRLTRLEALRGMTIDPAYASFSEDRLGSLEPGKRADYVVLSKDIMDEDLEFGEVVETRVVATVIDGRVVFGEV